MKKFCADTNFILSFLTDRNIDQQKTAEKYFEKASRAEIEIIIVENVITELVYVMKSVYKMPSAGITNILKALAENPGIIIDTHFSIDELLKIWPLPVQDYGDALIILYARNHKTDILTFDKKMKRSYEKLNT